MVALLRTLMTAPPLPPHLPLIRAAVAPPELPLPIPPPASIADAVYIKRREGLAASFAALALSLTAPAAAAILEADEDEELLERVKRDRKKRLQRQGVISSSSQETSYLQELVYKLIKVGQAIENDDLPVASTLLGSSINASWVQNINTSFTKLSASPEEKVEVDKFNSSLASLFSAFGNRDIESSKLAFVSSASALERWIGLTGLDVQIKGL